MRVLVTMLGKGKRTPEGTTKYVETSYRFPGSNLRRGSYFGMELAKEIQPDRIVFVGTASSMWDVLVEDLATEEMKSASGMEASRLELMQAVEEGCVDMALLAPFAPALAATAGCEVDFRLIPVGMKDEEQRDVLQAIASGVEGAGTVAFDVTHGFRHLGMLGFLSTFAIERMRAGPPLEVEALWYGAHEMAGADGVAPAVRLDGLMRIQQWVDALGRFDASGNYGVFSPLLEADGVAPEIAVALRDAALLESNINLGGAKGKLEPVLKSLEGRLAGASGMFQDRLRERLAWIRLPTPQAQHFALAHSALERQDFLRATILALEGFVAGLAWSDRQDPYAYSAREQAKEQLEVAMEAARRKGELPDEYRAYQALRALRNALAHGTPPKADHFVMVEGRKQKLRNILKDCDLLARTIRRSIAILEQWQPSIAASGT